jgi:hypothetical protein
MLYYDHIHSRIDETNILQEVIAVEGETSGSRPGDSQPHNGTGFLLLVLSRYIGDPDVINH